MQARDDRDRNRDVAPLKASPNAKIIDTTFMDADAVMAEALAHIASTTS
jgi:cytidylate kinase